MRFSDLSHHNQVKMVPLGRYVLPVPRSPRNARKPLFNDQVLASFLAEITFNSIGIVIKMEGLALQTSKEFQSAMLTKLDNFGQSLVI